MFTTLQEKETQKKKKKIKVTPFNIYRKYSNMLVWEKQQQKWDNRTNKALYIKEFPHYDHTLEQQTGHLLGDWHASNKDSSKT